MWHLVQQESWQAVMDMAEIIWEETAVQKETSAFMRNRTEYVSADRTMKAEKEAVENALDLKTRIMMTFVIIIRKKDAV